MSDALTRYVNYTYLKCSFPITVQKSVAILECFVKTRFLNRKLFYLFLFNRNYLLLNSVQDIEICFYIANMHGRVSQRSYSQEISDNSRGPI